MDMIIYEPPEKGQAPWLPMARARMRSSNVAFGIRALVGVLGSSSDGSGGGGNGDGGASSTGAGGAD
jgi:hypothetical protein